MNQNNMVLVSLVGEQPAPNVLPLRHYRPRQIVLVHTDFTAGMADRIASVISGEFSIMRPFCKTDPFHVDNIRSELKEYLEIQAPEADLLFNLTGGTKTMEYAALDVARQKQARAFYYQTEGNQNLIHPYHFTESGEMVCDLPVPAITTLSIKEFLSLYVRDFKPAEERENAGKDFERKVIRILQELGVEYELLPNQRLSGLSENVEIDFVLRFRHTFAVGEIKLHGSKTNGVDQLNSATDQRMLGTYTKKFLISVDELHPNDVDLATVSRIETVILPSGGESELSKHDQENLVNRIRKVLEPRV